MTAETTGPDTGTSGLGTRAARGVVVTVGGTVPQDRHPGRFRRRAGQIALAARLRPGGDGGHASSAIGEIFRDFGLSSAAVQAQTLSRGQRIEPVLDQHRNRRSCSASSSSLRRRPDRGAVRCPELAPIARALAVTLPAQRSRHPVSGRPQRHLRFTALAVADVSAPVIALVVALTTAVLGWGYWALVAQQVTSGVVLTVVLVIACAGWLVPGSPAATSRCAASSRFGLNLVGSQLIGYVGNNIDSFIIGRRFGASSSDSTTGRSSCS